MLEIDLVKSLQLRASEFGARLFRNNTGQGWVGQMIRCDGYSSIRVQPGDVLIRNSRPLHAGLCVGSSDLIGWTSEGKFLAVECKTDRGRLTEHQNNFLTQVKQDGGIAILARSVDDLIL